MVDPEWFGEKFEDVGNTEIISMNYDKSFFKNWNGHYLVGIDYLDNTDCTYYVFSPKRAISNSRLSIKIKHDTKYEFTPEIAERIIPELFPEYLI